MSIDNPLDIMDHTLKALEGRPRDARCDRDPADMPEDTRPRWVDMSKDEKLERIWDYMSPRIERGQPTLQLWFDAISSVNAIDYIGRLIVAEDDSIVW